MAETWADQRAEQAMAQDEEDELCWRETVDEEGNPLEQLALGRIIRGLRAELAESEARNDDLVEQHNQALDALIKAAESHA